MMVRVFALVVALALVTPVQGFGEEIPQQDQHVAQSGERAKKQEYTIEQAYKDGCGGFYIFFGGSPAECKPTAPRPQIEIPDWAYGT